MKRSLLVVLSLAASVALATPGGHSWPLNGCTTSCTSPTTGQTTGNAQCVTSRCLPEVRFAASMNNTGGMTLAGSQAIPYATALVNMQSGFNRWTPAQVTSCSTSIAFAFQSTFSTPTGTAAISGGDGNNNVIYLSGSNWRYGSGTLGLTGTRFFTAGEITDADMELNGNTAWATDGRSSAIDQESVVVHEAGHFIGFDHTTSGNAVMNPSVANGVIKRALLAPDLSDVCTVYPGMTGGQGSSCTSSTTCTGGRVCEGPTGSTSKICTQDCTTVGQTCPAGYSCQASTNGFACLPQMGSSDLCRFCASGSDCSTGTCLTDGSGHNWCSASCDPAVANSCGAGFNCATTMSGSSFCQPATACTMQCTTATVATDCAPGYTCTNGTCDPTGNVGDRCDVSGVCDACGLCVTDQTDPNIAFCRACCNGLADCAGCTATTCASGTCQPLQSTEQVCLPSSGGGVALCMACSATNPCQSGLICAAGLCRSQCNPASPGACPACVGLTSGGGVCACGTSEISDEGQPCTTTVPIRLCRTGTRCVGGTCRTPCTPTATVPCSGGFTCTNFGGTNNFCIPGGAGGGSAGTGGGTSGTGGGTSGTGGGTSGTGGGTSGTGGGTSGTGGGTSGPGGGASGTGGGTSGVGGGASGTGGGASGSGGGSSGTGGSGAGPVGLTCGASNCSGCCNNGVCVSFPSAERCGASGSECRACTASQTCSAAGACVAKPPASCISCSAAGWSPFVLGVLAFLARRRAR